MMEVADLKKIPIRNIYYLLIYSWNKLEESNILNVSSDDCTDLMDLFAKVLISGVLHLKRRGFDRGYLSFCEETSCLRGKIDFNLSVKKMLFKQGKMVCHFDDLDYNVLHNKILKTTLCRLIKYEKLDSSLKSEIVEIIRMLHEVETIPLSKRIFGMVQLHSNNYFYDFLMKICELIYESLIPDKKEGIYKFKDFIEDKRKMNMVFENFVRNFYRLEQSQYKVRREEIVWDFIPLNEEDEDYLPVMQTDVTLESNQKKIIIDTKFYQNTYQVNYGKVTLHSGNLYQMFSYIKNVENRGGEKNANCEGILLYPTIKEELNKSYKHKSHKIHLKTVNLNQEWIKIENRLLELIEE